MTGHRAGRTGDQRRRTGAGGLVIKRCGACTREVLSAYRGEVSAAGRGEIALVRRNGDIVGRCECGNAVTWERVRPVPMGTTT